MPKQGRNRGQITAEGQSTPTVAVGAGWGATGSAALSTGANDVAGQVVIVTAPTTGPSASPLPSP